MVNQATVVQLADEHPAGATLAVAVVVAVRLVGEAAVVAAHPAGEAVVPLLVAARLVGVVMADALLMVEEMDHERLTAVAMAPELLTEAQPLTEAPLLMAERQHTVVTMGIVPHMVASTPVAAHRVGVDRQQTPLRNPAASLLLRLVPTTPQHLVLTPHPLPVAMVLTLRLRQAARLWMLLRLATMLRLPLVIHRAVDTVLRRPHQVLGMLRRQHLVAILGTIRKLSFLCKIDYWSMGSLRQTAK